jgi:hypothetical protein
MGVWSGVKFGCGMFIVLPLLMLPVEVLPLLSGLLGFSPPNGPVIPYTSVEPRVQPFHLPRTTIRLLAFGGATASFEIAMGVDIRNPERWDG